MPYVREIEPDQATGRLKEIYEDMLVEWGGRIPAVLQVLSLRPETLDSVRKQNRVIAFGGSTLGRRWEEMIATVVSSRNGCYY